MNYLNLKYLMAVCLLLCYSVTLMAQPKEQRVTVKIKNGSIEELFASIESQSTYRFSYRDGLINSKKDVTVNMSTANVKDILDAVLPTIKLKHFVVSDRSIVISELKSKTIASKKIKISGVVTDADGETIIGANIFEKDNIQNGTMTDIDGRYTVTVPSNSKLVVSYIGYKRQEINVAGSKQINIKLIEDADILDEVVVIGYGSMKKSDLTGSTISVKSDELRATHAQSLSQALQGKASGVQVSTTSAAPGGASSIRIRGTNSLLADASPLYVVDGFPVDDINNINLNDVASVEILKDASSTAIYGSRGANGVILIQTNTGVASAPQFNFSSSFGFQEVYRKVDLLNGSEFATLFNEYQINNGEKAYYDGSHRDRPSPDQIGDGTDWFDQIMQPGFIQSYNLSAAGGTENMQYRISGGYYDNEGVIKGGNFNRLNLNANNKIDLNKWLNLQMGLFLSRTDTDGSGDRTGLETSSGTLNNAMKMSPVINVYDEYGNYNANNFPGTQSNENPLAYANEVLDNIIVDNIVANVNLGINPFDGLNLQIKLGANIKHQDGYSYLSKKTIEGAKIDGRAAISSVKRANYVNEYIANYKKKLKKHNLFLTGAFSLEQNQYEYNSITGTGLAIDDLSYAGIASAEVVSQPVFAKTQSSLMSVLGRINYNYDNRYLVTLTNRMDGNSGFADGKKWGNFPSAALAWRISQEDFLSGVEFIHDFKLRMGWGLTGNSKIGNNRSLSLLSDQRYPFGDDVSSGIGPSSIGNPDLKWETTEMYNLGIDLNMFNNRLRFTAEAYYKYTSDMLMSYDIPVSSGYQKAYINAGELENKGLEFSLNAAVIDTDNFKWDLGGNISFNRDKVTKLYDSQSLVVEIGDKQSIWIEEGNPIRQFQGSEVLGIFRDLDDVNSHVWVDEKGTEKLIQANAKPGDIKYKDNNNDGKIDNLDNIVYGSAFPDFTYGITNKIQYKGFAFDLFINGSQGNWVQNRTLAYLRNTSNIRNNLSAELVDRWTPENIDTNIPRLGSENNLPSFEDASYIRIQNISLSYSFPKRLIKNIDGLTLSASIENLYVWTDYSGWDPDVNSAFGGSENMNVGQDVNSYPKPRVYRVGLNFKF